MKATFDSEGILITKYWFHPASIYPQGRIEIAAIRDVDPTADPPEIRTLRGETLFVSPQQSDAFRDWIENAQLPIVSRVDVWHLILEPFLDTEFTIEWHEKTLTTLSGIGVSRMEVNRIRKCVGRAMLGYNFWLWDWVHLGLVDVLTATRRGLNWLSLTHRLSPRRFNDFYWSAMELADRGRNVGAEMANGRSREPEQPSESN